MYWELRNEQICCVWRKGNSLQGWDVEPTHVTYPETYSAISATPYPWSKIKLIRHAVKVYQKDFEVSIETFYWGVWYQK